RCAATRPAWTAATAGTVRTTAGDGSSRGPAAGLCGGGRAHDRTRAHAGQQLQFAGVEVDVDSEVAALAPFRATIGCAGNRGDPALHATARMRIEPQVHRLPDLQPATVGLQRPGAHPGAAAADDFAGTAAGHGRGTFIDAPADPVVVEAVHH